MAGDGAVAHPDKSSADYVERCLDCHYEKAPMQGELKRFDIGLRNTCDDYVVAVLCTDEGSGFVRYAEPVNLPPEHLHVWSIWDPPKNLRLRGFACRPNARCMAGPKSHDPHCFQK